MLEEFIFKKKLSRSQKNKKVVHKQGVERLAATKTSNKYEGVAMKYELIDTFLDEYMRFLVGLKDIKKVSPDGNCVASLTKEDGKYLYELTWKDGRHVGEYIRPFRPTESNIRKFNQGCAECARILRIYLETGDISKAPMGPAFGELSCEWYDGQPADMHANFDKGRSNDLQTDKRIMNGLNKIRENFLKQKGLQSSNNKNQPDADLLAHFLMNQLFEQFDLGDERQLLFPSNDNYFSRQFLLI